jgi:hypothetical protein
VSHRLSQPILQLSTQPLGVGTFPISEAGYRVLPAGFDHAHLAADAGYAQHALSSVHPHHPAIATDNDFNLLCSGDVEPLERRQRCAPLN